MAETKSRRSYTRPVGMKPAAKARSGDAARSGASVPPSWWGWLILWIVTLSAVGWGLTRLDALAIRRAPETLRIEWVDLPDWLAAARKDDPGGVWASILTGLEAAADLPSRKLYDENLCDIVGQRIGASAWIEEVTRVAKTTNGVVRVHARFRKPFGLVEKGRTAFLIDEAGVLLPMKFASADVDRLNWYSIIGVAAPPPREGTKWPGDDLQAGIRLAQFLKRMMPHEPPIRAMITAISVANWGGKKYPNLGQLRLATKNPAISIHWGLPPGEEYGMEPSAERKLAYLLTPTTLRLVQENKAVELRERDEPRPSHWPEEPIE